MSSDIVLLTIHPEHASQIYSGQKRAELRKSFPANARIVFLYETAPVAAVTGAFSVKSAIQMPVSHAVDLAETHGIDPNRAENYYGERDKGWVVEVGLRVRFKESVSLTELRRRDHYFAVPQTFAYLDRFEGLTQFLMERFVSSSASEVQLRPIGDAARGLFESLMLTDVGTDYEDIDSDFVSQILDSDVGLRAAFSTTAKHVLEAYWGSHVVGFTVLTEKSFGAWKTGPSILLAEYRGLGLGQVVRRVIREYCAAHGAKGIYCTAAESKPTVVSYLLNAGMHFQARLREHLQSGRDELVFSETLTYHRTVSPLSVRKPSSPRSRVMRLQSNSKHLPKGVEFFLALMPYWYFKPHAELKEALLEGIAAFDRGTKKYSDKGRSFYVLRGGNGQMLAAALMTMKRSKMAKINFVSAVDSIADQTRVIEKLLQEHPSLRRIYMTIPMSRPDTVLVAASLGFGFEGVLKNPFGSGLDHACLGLVKRRAKVQT